jgi:hypothetical protein
MILHRRAGLVGYQYKVVCCPLRNLKECLDDAHAI